MNIGELIAALSRFPQDRDVHVIRVSRDSVIVDGQRVDAEEEEVDGGSVG
jgi:hypothetical protein